MIATEEIKLDKRILKSIVNDVSRTAETADLYYVSSSDPGYSRVKNGAGFYYLDGRMKLNEEEELLRIKRLVIPPAWENVWICKRADGHLQATGIDKLGRKQYRYHPRWNMVRNQTKFYRLRAFGEALPAIRKRIETDIKQPGYTKDKVLAVMVSLMQKVNLRVGNAFYEKLYGSFGLTTLKDHHVQIDGTNLMLMFKGKKGVEHKLSLRSRKLSKIIQGCKDIPGKELFQYYDEEGIRRSIDSGMVNSYIREISGSDFTAKDFRTWAGTLHAILAFKEVGDFTTVTEMNKKIPVALDIVAKQLGNTRTVTRKYYVHPVVVNLYQEGKLQRYINELEMIEEGKDDDGYTKEESILMKILRNP